MLAALHKHHAGSEYFSANLNMREFTVRHFAAPVTYTICGFMDRNMDSTCTGFVSTFRGDSVGNPFVAALFTSGAVATESHPQNTQFQIALDEIFDTFDNTEPWFVICMRPNTSNVPDQFDAGTVGDQALTFQNNSVSPSVKTNFFRYARFHDHRYYLGAGKYAPKYCQDLMKKMDKLTRNSNLR